MTSDPLAALRTAEEQLSDADDAYGVQAVLVDVVTVLHDQFGVDDPAVRMLSSLTLPNRNLRWWDPQKYTEHLSSTVTTALRVIARATQRLESGRPAGVGTSAVRQDHATGGLPLDESAVDPDLWKYVGSLVQNGDWAHVASAACRFLEHKLRAWKQPESDADASRLVAGLFGDRAPLALGDNEGQRQGWEQLIRGLLMGPRNAVQHGIDERPAEEVRRFGAGVVGTVTVILTEIKSRHPQRCSDLTEPPDADND